MKYFLVLDIDECFSKLHDCVDEKQEQCVNNEGSYACLCKDGYNRTEGARVICNGIQSLKLSCMSETLFCKCFF